MLTYALLHGVHQLSLKETSTNSGLGLLQHYLRSQTPYLREW